jgi:hypothetical protein
VHPAGFTMELQSMSVRTLVCKYEYTHVTHYQNQIK